MIDLKEKFAADSIDISEEWLDTKDYELKILILTSILAENNLAYRGSLKTMCEWLGIKSSANNNKNLKAALEILAEKGYIFYKVEGRTYHISISNKGMKKNQIVKVRRMWVDAFKKYNKDEDNNKIDDKISIDWIKILKVFVFLYKRTYDTCITTAYIAECLNMSDTTVGIALKAIEECDLKGIMFERIVNRYEYTKNNKTEYRTLGTDYSFLINFEE